MMKRRVATVGFLFLAIASSVPITAFGSDNPDAGTPPSPTEWHKAMLQTPPGGKGCFEAVHPNTAWQEVPCAAAVDLGPVSVPPTMPAPSVVASKTTTPGPLLMGNGTSGLIVSVAYPNDTLSYVTGYFSQVTGITSIRTVGDVNAYSLQLNTNTFSTDACNGAANPANCSGWQQFVYQNYGDTSRLAIWDWLLGWGGACDTNNGWHPYQDGTRQDCYKDNETWFDPAPFSSFSTLAVTGEATSSQDAVFFYYLDSGVSKLKAVSQNSVLGLAQGWKFAEYNIFGVDGNSNVADILPDPGSSIVVEMNAQAIGPQSSIDPTICVTGNSMTFEWNNLNLFGPCCFDPSNNGYWFYESNTDGTNLPLCLYPACVPGTRRCSGAAVETCNTNIAWQATETCAYRCFGNGVCLAPVPDLDLSAQASFEYYETEWGSREPAMKLTWHALSGSADGVLIMVGEGQGTLPPLVNGTPVYCPGTQDRNFGTQVGNSGWRCIYRMNASNSGSLDIYGLQMGHRYWATIVPYNQLATGEPTYSGDPGNAGVVAADPPVAVPALGKSFQVALAILLCGALLFRTSRRRGNADRA